MLMARVVLFFIPALFLSACSKEVQKIKHKVSNEDPLTNVLNTQFTGALALDATEKFNAKYGITKLDRQSSSMLFGLEDPFENKVKPMAEVLLVEELYEHTELQNMTAERVFSRFHSAMVDALALEERRSEVLKFVTNYVDNYLLRGCNDELEECRYKDFYRRVRYTKELLLARLKYVEGDRCGTIDTDEYYRLVHMSYGYIIGRDDPRLDAYYVECARTYLNKLQAKEVELRGLSNDDPRKVALPSLETEIRDHGEKISQIIARSDRIIADEELKLSYARFYTEIQPLHYNASSQPVGVSLHILKDARLRVLLEDAKKGRINDASYLKALDSDEGFQADEYAYERMREYLNEKSGKMLAALGIKMLEGRSVYLMILEKIVTRQWGSHLATKFFDHLHDKDHDKLEKVIQHYVQIMMLHQVAESNDEMGSFFNNIDFSTKEMLSRVSEKALTLQKDWVEFHDAVKVVRDFTVAALDIPYDELSKIGIDVDGLVDATNYMVVLPHMMLMAYKMYERRFSMELETWFGTVRIKYTDVFDYFFSSGTMASWGVRPWFNYSPGGLQMNGWGRNYNTAAMINAFYFALRTGAFELYQVKPEDFLKGTMGTLISEHHVLVREMYEHHLSVREKKAVVYEQAKEFCAEERMRNERSKQGLPYVARYRHEIDFSDLNSGILITRPFMEQLTGKSASSSNDNRRLFNNWVVYGSDSLAWFWQDKQEMLDLIRLGGGYWVHYLGAMRTIFSEYKKDLFKIENSVDKLTVEQISAVDASVRSFDGVLREYEHDKRRLFTLMRQSIEETMLKCTLVATQRELDLFHLLYIKEVEFLRETYREWLAAIELPNAERKAQALEALNAKLSEEVAESAYNYTGRTYVDETHLHYAKLDVYMRLRNNIPEVSPEIAVRMPEKASEFHALDRYEESHLVAEIPITLHNGSRNSEDEFIRMAMGYWGPRQLATIGDQYISWAAYYGSKISHNYLQGLAAYYMLGEVEMYESDNLGQCLRRALPNVERCRVKRQALIGVEEYQHENMSLARLVSVREDQEKLYEDMGISMFLDNGFIYYTGFSPTLYDSRTAGIITEPDKIEELSVLDTSYLLASYSKLLGYRPNYPWEENDINMGGGGQDNYNPDRITPWAHLKIYKESRGKFDFLLFKVKSETTEAVDGIFVDFYKQNKALVQDFEAAAVLQAEEDKRRVATGETWFGLDGKEYPFRRSVRISTRRPRVYDQYITQAYLDEYRLKLRNFNQSTEFFYDPEPAPEPTLERGPGGSDPRF